MDMKINQVVQTQQIEQVQQQQRRNSLQELGVFVLCGEIQVQRQDSEHKGYVTKASRNHLFPSIYF